MPVVDTYNLERQKVGECDLDGEVFDVTVREHLFHEVVRAQRDASRAWTAKVKERGEVKGTTAKAYRQKGTGRARQGNKKAAHFRGGGVAHGPRPISSGIKVNRKVRAAALKAALSRRQQEGSLFVLEDFALSEAKTGHVARTLQRFDASKALVVDTDNHALAQSARNLADSRYLPVAGLNVYDVLYHDVLILTRAAVDAIHGRFQS